MASEIIKRLTERRLQVWEQAKALAEHAAEEGRGFSGEEQSQWDTLNAELEALDRRRKAIADAEERAKNVEEQFTALERIPQKPGAQQGAGDEDRAHRAQELRDWLTGKTGQREFLVSPPTDHTVDFRTLSELTNAAGKYTVPTSFYNRLVEHLVETATILRMGVTVLNTTSGEVLQIPKTLTHGAAAAVAEAAALQPSDPTFGVVNLGAFKFGQLIQISRELIADSGVDIEGYLARAAGRNLGLAVAPKLITGTGTTEPRGVVTDATQGAISVTGVTGGFGVQSTAGQGADVLIDLFYSVIAPYRASNAAAWLMKDSTAAVVRKLKTSTGEYAWQPGLTAGQPDSILGKPVYTDPNVAAVALNAKSVLFGDFSQFFVRMVGPIRFERSDDFAFSSDLVTFRAIMRIDASLVDLTGAVKYFVGAAS